MARYVPYTPTVMKRTHEERTAIQQDRRQRHTSRRSERQVKWSATRRKK